VAEKPRIRTSWTTVLKYFNDHIGFVSSRVNLLVFQRHFCVFALSFPGKDALKTIYSSIYTQHLKLNKFSMSVQKHAANIIEAALALHQRVSQVFLPTAIKFHYVFNLRDLSNIFQVSFAQCKICL